jgi:hypothetical protein
MLKNFIFAATAAAALTLPTYAQEVEETAAPAIQEPSAEMVLAGPLKEILKNVPLLMDQQWKSNMTFNMDMGENGKAKITVGLLSQDMKHFVADINFDIETGEETGQGPMKGTAKLLADGEFLYLDGDMPAEMTQGLPLPVKIQMSLFDSMIAQAGGGEAEDEKKDLKSTVREGLTGALGGATFEEEGTTETNRRYVFSSEEAAGWITFGTKIWLPSGLEVKGDGNSVTMTSTGNAHVEEFAKGAFTFTVAEGKSVMDMTPMLQGMFGGPPAAAEEDLEF